MAEFWRENRKQLIFLILLPVIVFPWTATGLSRFAGVDIAKLHQPMRWFDVQSLYAGQWPLWNPDIFSGFPQFAEGESGFLYLGNLPQYLPVDFSYAYTLVMLLHFSIAAILAYAYLRRNGLDRHICSGFAVIWAYSPFFIFHLSAPTIYIVLTWYPGLLLLADSLPGRPFRRLGWLAILSSQMLLAGSIQMAFFGFVSFFIYSLLRWIWSRGDIPGATMRYIWVPLIGVVLGGIIAAIQLMPTRELMAFTERAGELSASFRAIGSWVDFTRLGSVFVFPLIGGMDQLLHYGSSLLYQGLIPGILLLCCLLYGWRDNRIRVHLIAGIILVLLAMGTRNPFNAWMSEVPPFDKLRYMGRFAGFASWHFLTAGALWLSVFLARYPAGKLDWVALRKTLGLPILILIILLGIFFFTNGAPSLALAGTCYGVLQLIVLVFLMHRAPYRKHIATASAIFAIVLAYPLGNLLQINAAEYNRVMTTFRYISAARPDARILIMNEGPLISTEGRAPLFLAPYRSMKGFTGGNAASMAGLNVLSGYSPLKFDAWREIIEGSVGAADRSPYHSPEGLAAVLRPDYVVTSQAVTIDGYALEAGADLKGIADDGFLYRSKRLIPGYFFAEEIVSHDGLPAHEMLDLALEPYNKNIIHVLSDLPPGKRPVDGRITSHTRLKQGYRFEGDFVDGNFLVVLDSWYPGWVAYVDGEEVPIYLVNGLFKGVEVLGGSHCIEFRYRPGSFHTGMILSIIGLGLAIVLIAVPIGRDVSIVK